MVFGFQIGFQIQETALVPLMDEFYLEVIRIYLYLVSLDFLVDVGTTDHTILWDSSDHLVGDFSHSCPVGLRK